MTTSISIRSLTKTYDGGVTAVRDLSLDVPAGSVFGFLGANGAGKTTTIRIIAGLTHPSAGRVSVAGIPSEAGLAYRRQIGYLAQEPAFYGWMTGREALRYVAGFHPWLDELVEPRIAGLLDLVGLADAVDRRTAEYSGGMRRRLGIAQALVGRPTVIVLDEPASGLDPLGRRDVLRLMQQLRGTTTVFYSTHILDDVQRVADHVAILDCGRLVTAAPTASLLAESARGVLRVELAGARPDTAKRLRGLAGVTDVIVESAEPLANTIAYEVRIRAGAQAAVQVGITRFAADEGLALLEARPASLDLETVFLNLIDDQEHAA
jgi:ABC-2 type transport system ATP-binding protein